MWTIGLHFGVQEITSESGLNAESGEKAGSNLRGESVLGLAVGRKGEGVTAVRCEGCDTLCRALPIQIVRVRRLCTGRVVVILIAQLAEMKQLVGIAIRQWMQEGRINH